MSRLRITSDPSAPPAPGPQVWQSSTTPGGASSTLIGRARRGHFVYSPFAPITGVRKLGTSWESWDKFTVVRHGDNPQPLAVVGNDDILFIVCHCGPQATNVQDNAHNKLTAAQLAQRISDDGLNPRHRVLKFFGCSGGVGGYNSFASQLLRELRNLTVPYMELEMYAYLSSVTSVHTDGHRYGYMKVIQNFDQFGFPVYAQQKVRASNVRIRVT